jgi:hypothetical protein
VPDTGHCCGCGACTPCSAFTLTITDATTGDPLKWARVLVKCGGEVVRSLLTGASGVLVIDGVCECATGELYVCRLCYDPQTITFNPCPADASVALVRTASHPSLWVTNDTPYNNTWDGSAWSWPADLPKIYVELTYQEVTDPTTGIPYYAWFGCEPFPEGWVPFGSDAYTPCHALTPFGSSVPGNPPINVVLSCGLDTATGVANGLSFWWLTSGLLAAPIPADFTDCFDWNASTTVDGSGGFTSIYGVATDPNCLPQVAGALGRGPFAPCGWADETLFTIPRGVPGRYWVIRTTDPTPP